MSLATVIKDVESRENKFKLYKGRTIRKVMGGGGGFLACKNFFFWPTGLLPVQEFFFFDCSAVHEFFFS